MPGSPPTSTTEPRTSPPPSTRSKLVRLVEMRGARSPSISLIGTGATAAFSDARPPAVRGSSSAYEFQALHSGHRPSHLFAWLPHSRQEKTIAFLATAADCMRRGSLYAA